MTDGTLLRALRHNSWANDRLIAFCSKLTEEQLAWTVPGTFGSVHSTLGHIVGAEHGYLFRLTGEQPRGGPLARGQIVPFDELRERARSNAGRMEAVLGGPFDPVRVITMTRGTATAGIVAAQYLHHGSDHRAHVGTILGAHGLEPPALDVWSYAREIGEEIVPPG